MSEVGLKFDDGKTDYSLVPFDALEQVVKVLMVGAKKYGPFNWSQVDNAEQRYFSAAMRHLSAHAQGQLKDQETGLPHLAHAACCMLFLLSHLDKEPQGDE